MQYPSPLQMFSFTDPQFQLEPSLLGEDYGGGSSYSSSPSLHFFPQLDPDDYNILLRGLHLQPPPSSVPDTSTTPSLSPPPPSEPSHDKGSSLQAPPPPRKSPPCTGSTTRRRTMRKDRHSKIVTAKGPRDRRMRLSLDVAKKFFDLQDTLHFDKPSKTVEWLLNKSKDAIKSVASCSSPQRHHRRCGSSGGVDAAKTESSTSECEVDSASMAAKNKAVDPSVAAASGGVCAPAKARRTATARPPRKARILHPAVMKETRAKARARARERTRDKKMRKELGQPPPLSSLKTLSFEEAAEREKNSSTTSKMGAEVNQESANYNQSHRRRSAPGQQGLESGSFPMMIAGESDEISIYDYDSSIINNAVDGMDYFQEQCNMHSSGRTAEAQRGTADVHYHARVWEGFPIF